MVRFAILVLSLSLSLALAPGAAAAATFDYLYIESNEGGSSGGHAAVRLGDDTWHFQYAEIVHGSGR